MHKDMPVKISFPARKANGDDYADLKEMMDVVGREPHGSWLAGTNRMWHGGIHLTEVTAPGAVLGENTANNKAVPLQCMADGEIVAWRINSDYMTADYCGQRVQYSSTFLLVKSWCKPDPDNAKSWLEFYSLYMGLAPLSAFPKYSCYRVTEQGDGVRLRRYSGYETTGQPVPEPTGDTLREGGRVLILCRETFVLQGKVEPFGLAQPLKDGKPQGATCWVSLREGYLEVDGNEYGKLPDWMRQAVAQGVFDAVVVPDAPNHITAGNAVGFLAEDIAPAGMCKLAPSHFSHFEVLSVDPRMPDFLTNPGNIDTGKKFIRLGLHKPLYLRNGDAFEPMSAVTEHDGGKLLECEKCHPTESGGKTWYQIRPHTWMCGDDVDEVRQFDLAEREFSALVEDSSSDMKNSLKEGWMRDVMSWFAERMNPEKGMRQGMMSCYYKGMVESLDTDHDDMLSAQELYKAVHHPEMGVRRLASRLVVKHESEWFGGSAHHKWTTFFQNYDVLRVKYAKKWLDDCEWMSQVPAFSSGAAVWHMHPVVFLDAIKLNTRKKISRPKNVQNFLDMAAGSAEVTASKWGVPASVLLAQSALESGWGEHVKNNAYFGIKGKSPSGDSVSFGTTEVINGKIIHIKDTFRAYSDYAESADDYGRFLNGNKRYKPAFSCRDKPNDFIISIANAGYATDPNYATKLIHLMERYDLYEFDK